MIVTKAGYQIRRSLTQWDYEIITLEVSQQLEQEQPTDGTEMLSYCKELVQQFYSPVQAAQAPVVQQVAAQKPYTPVPGAQRATPNGGYPARQGGPKGPPRASTGQYAYAIPFREMNDSWKAMCKQSGGGWDGISKQWKSNTLLPGAEQYLVSGPSGGSPTQQALGDDDIPFGQ